MENENLTRLFINDSVFISLHLLLGEYPHQKPLVVPDPPLELFPLRAHWLPLLSGSSSLLLNFLLQLLLEVLNPGVGLLEAVPVTADGGVL